MVYKVIFECYCLQYPLTIILLPNTWGIRLIRQLNTCTITPAAVLGVDGVYFSMCLHAVNWFSEARRVTFAQDKLADVLWVTAFGHLPQWRKERRKIQQTLEYLTYVTSVNLRFDASGCWPKLPMKSVLMQQTGVRSTYNSTKIELKTIRALLQARTLLCLSSPV